MALIGLVMGALTLRDVHRVRRSLDRAHAIAVEATGDPSALASDPQRASLRSRLTAADAALGDAENGIRSSFSLRALRIVPIASRQANGLLQVVVDSRTATRAGIALLDAFTAAAPDLKFRDGQLNLASVAQVEGAARDASAALASAVHPARGLIGPLGGARRLLDDKADDLSTRLATSADALDAMRSFLGGSEPRRYIVAIQNNAEMRDSGMVLSYAVVSFVNGHMAVERHGSIQDFDLSTPVPIAMPRGTDLAWGDEQPTRLWQSVMAPADFAWSGRVMQAMYHQATGSAVDGVIAIDVPGLAAALRATGPVTVASIGETLSADNLASVLLDQLYRGLTVSQQSFRHLQLADAATEMLAHVANGSTDTVTLGRELGGAAAGGHLRLWSARESEERVLERTGLGGGPATQRPDRTFHVAVENATATKLDYWVKPTIHIDVTLTDLGSAVVRTRVTIANGAPKTGASQYQVGPDGLTQSRAGEYRARVAQWAPPQSVQPGALSESGLGLQQKGAVIQAGAQGSVDFLTVIPNAVRNGRLVLRLVPQPRLEPAILEVTLNGSGWHASGGPPASQPFAHTVTAVWKVRHK